MSSGIQPTGPDLAVPRPADVACDRDPAPPRRAAAIFGFRAVRLPGMSDLLRDLPAGAIAALVILAYDLSYAALLFQGKYAGGVPQALWSLLIGAVIIGTWSGLTTSNPALSFAMDTPTMAVFVVLAVSVTDGVTARGGPPGEAITHVLVALWFAGVISSVLLLVLGTFKVGKAFRFIPYGVVGGFLSATGFLLMISGVSLAIGRRLTPATIGQPLATPDAVHLAVGVGFALVVLALRWRIKSAALVPVVFSIGCAAAAIAPRVARFPGSEQGWLLRGIDKLEAWSPLAMLRDNALDWPMLLGHLPQVLAISAVVVISNIVKITGLEVARSRSADLDHELWTNGASNLLGAIFAGFATSYIVSISRLLDETGARTRWAGIVAALIVGLVLVTRVDLPAVAPVPILAGLLMYLGYGLMTDSLRRPFKQRAWYDLALAAAIACVCVRFGYVVGILAGFVASCLLFAYSYSRIGTIRRHLTRASFASNVERSREASDALQAAGDAIHIFWLTGYLFFGSSDRLVLTVRRLVEGERSVPIRFLVFDCSGVSGLDASAVMSLLKLKNYCAGERVTLAFSDLSAPMRSILDRDNYVGAGVRAFPTRNEALAWCEDEVLRGAALAEPVRDDGLEGWLRQAVDAAAVPASDIEALLGYLQTKEIDRGGGVLYRQGEAAETIDLIVKGSVAIVLEDATGASYRVRTMTTRTIVGEMGFFRRGTRTASVVADGEASVLTLTRASFERMQRDDPALANHFLLFIIRILAGRVEFANKEITALL